VSANTTALTGFNVGGKIWGLSRLPTSYYANGDTQWSQIFYQVAGFYCKEMPCKAAQIEDRTKWAELRAIIRFRAAVYFFIQSEISVSTCDLSCHLTVILPLH
jgi:hypothetical protein